MERVPPGLDPAEAETVVVNGITESHTIAGKVVLSP